MNYKDTVLKQSQIKWKTPKVKYIEDGKVDLFVNIPLTNILEKQALNSFTHGILQAIIFTATSEQAVTNEILKGKFAEWGLPQKLIDTVFEKRTGEERYDKD